MFLKIFLTVMMGGFASLLITGCATTQPQTAYADEPAKYQAALSQARPLGAHYATVGQEERAADVTTSRKTAEPTGPLHLTDALATALLQNPVLAAFSYEVRAAEARILQAGVLPNPEIALELEEYGRGGAGFDSAETAVVLGQLFELGGKRRWRTRIAAAEGDLAGWDYESKRLDIFAETAKRFTSALAAQQRLDLAGSAEELAEKTSLAVAERVKAGKESPLQASKSEAELEMARMEAGEAENALGVARTKLAAMWGVEQVSFGDVEGSLDGVLQDIPSLDTLRSRLALNPDLARGEAELRLRRAVVSAERAARVPDLEASVGYRHFEEDGTHAFAFGIGLPLPLFDRNQGNIVAAGHELSKAEAERAATESALVAELAEIHAALTSSHQRVKTLRGKVVPAMEQAFEAAREGYRHGKYGFLELLDAQRGLFEVKGALLDALSNYHVALIDIQRITGTRIVELTNNK